MFRERNAGECPVLPPAAGRGSVSSPATRRKAGQGRRCTGQGAASRLPSATTSGAWRACPPRRGLPASLLQNSRRRWVVPPASPFPPAGRTSCPPIPAEDAHISGNATGCLSGRQSAQGLAASVYRTAAAGLPAGLPLAVGDIRRRNPLRGCSPGQGRAVPVRRVPCHSRRAQGIPPPRARNNGGRNRPSPHTDCGRSLHQGRRTRTICGQSVSSSPMVSSDCSNSPSIAFSRSPR